MTNPAQMPPGAPMGRPPVPQETEPKRSVSPKLIAAGVLVVLVIVFIVENTAQVKIRFIAGPKVSAPMYLALIAAAVVGAAAAALIWFRRQHHNKN